jgi:hypothetical protein
MRLFPNYHAHSKNTHLIFSILQRRPGSFIKLLKYIYFHSDALPCFPTTNVIQYSINGLLRIIPCDSRFGVCEELGVGLESVGRSVESEEKKFSRLLESLETPVCVVMTS